MGNGNVTCQQRYHHTLATAPSLPSLTSRLACFKGIKTKSRAIQLTEVSLAAASWLV